MRYPNLIHTKSLHILLGWRGVFLAVFVAFLLTACGGVSAPVNIVVNPKDPDVVVDCETNPFGKDCGDEFTTQQDEKISECLIDGMAGTSDCAEAVGAQSCLGDPYADGCDENAGFSAFLEVAKIQREVFCRTDGNADDKLCAGAVETFCGDNPFDGLCDAGTYSVQRGEQVTACIADAKAGDSDCAAAVAFNPCIRNPFTPECIAQTDFRTTRETFCRKDDNAANALCAGALAHFCELDPFDAICDATAYSRQQNERTALCISDDNASNTALCANAVAQDACIRDPFTVACSTQNVARSIRESFCRQGTNATDNTALCGNAVMHVCADDPLDGLCDQMTRDMQLCTNDPFDAGCDPMTYEMQRATRTTECITGDNARAINPNPRCTNAIAADANDCIRKPYGTACGTDTPAQTARETFCRGNSSNPLCAGAVVHFCDTNTRPEADPFDGLCDPTTYETQRDTRVTACIAGDKANDPTCANAVKFNVCIRNPFTPECSGENDARNKRKEFCDESDNATKPLCAGAVSHFCAIDPFDGICDDTDYSRQQSERTALCISEANASNTALCANAVAQDACISDPFTVACSTQEVARSIRESFCRMGTNAADNTALCDNAARYICDSTARADADPFDGLCDAGTYETQRTARVTACIAGDKANDVALCAKAIADDECILDPYATGCESQDSNPTPAQTARTTFCRAGNEGNALCASTVTHVCTIVDPFDGWCDAGTYEMQRNTRLMECEKETPDPTLACINALAQGKCNLVDPFIAGCEGQINQQAAEEVFCRKGTNAADRLSDCQNTIDRVCGADPFDSICKESNFANLITDRATRVTACIAGDKANDDTLCANAIAFNACIRDPYGAGCDGDVDVDGVDEAQMMRETHCRAGNEDTALCAGAVVHFCTIDPYDDLCNMNNFDTLTTARAMRVATCAIGDNASNPDLCGGAIADAVVDCITDPYIVGCESGTTALTPAQTARETFCRGNVNPTLCTNAIAHFCDTNTRTAADPFDGLCDEITHSGQRATRVTACIAGDKANDVTLCANAVKFNVCIRNPFTPECSTQTDAQTAREIYCRGNENLTLCAGAVVHFCELDPFDTLCDDVVYSRQQSERVALCIKDKNASNDVLCAKAIADDVNACIRDPFTAMCSTEDVARSIRESFCRKSTNATANPTLCGNAVLHICTNDPLDGLCDQMTQKMRLCMNDPFTADCDPSTYEMERMMRTTECITGDNASDDVLCANAILDDSCIRDPYGAGCESKADARTARETYCRGNDNTALCAGAITHFCSADPFDGLCDEGTYSVQRGERVTACIAGDKADDPTCTNAVAANPCIRNPFNTNCKDDFANYYLSARTNRETFCKGRTDVTYDLTLCAGAIVHVCEADPFETLCNNNNNDDYARQKMERVDFCIRDDNASDTDLCMGAIAAAIVAGLNCITDPYATGCESKLTARAARESYCRGNTNPTLCGNAVLHFCTADPFDGLCNATNFTPYVTARGDRVTVCITGDNASDDALCANAILADSCILDPYDSACKSENPTLIPAQTARETYCRNNDSSNPLCAGAIVYFCDTDARNDADPFDALCDPAIYEMQRNTRMSDCAGETTANPRCTNALRQVGQVTCETHPYGADCAGNEPDRMTRENQCREGDNRDDAALCQGAVTHFCTIDPFDSLCNATNFTRYTEARSVFEGFCRADVAGRANDAGCENAVKHFCTVDPFDSLCNITNFTTFIDDRNMRNSLCRESENALGLANDTQCTGVLAHFCTIDPFDAVCNPTTYDALRTMRVAECIKDANADTNLCTGAIAQDICISTPYAMGCKSETPTLTPAQTARETFCRGNPSNPSNPLCAGAVAHFCETSSTANPFDAELCFVGTTYDTTRDSIITGCITDNNTRLEEGECTNALAANPCIRTPFDRNCEADFAPYYLSAQTKRTTFCAGQTDKSLDDSFCAGAIASDPCFNNPFVRNLNDGAYLCGSEFAARREEKISECIVGNEGQNVGCLNVLAGVGGCLANPFQDICADADNVYFKDYADRARAARVKFCDMDDKTIKDVDYCVGRTFVHDICIYDPFSSFCADDSFNVAKGTTLQAERTKKIIDCGGDDYEEPGSCAHVDDLVTAATWAHGFDDPLKTERPTTESAFLRATSASELDEGTSGATVTRTKLNLSTTTFDDIEFGDFDIEFDPESGRNAHDGVEFFQVLDGSKYYYYAGILGAANLGAPLTNDTTVLNWNGRIGISTISTIDPRTGSPIIEPGSQTDFTLTIEFIADGDNVGKLTSFAKVFLDRPDDIYYYNIVDAKFNASGLITSGTVVYAEFINGDQTRMKESPFAAAELRGIIGKEGALGVFQGAHFAGGFVAHPKIQSRVESEDWVRSFNPQPGRIPTTKNQFLQQTSGILLVGQIATEPYGSQLPVIEKLELNRIDAINDVSWFSGFDGNTQYYYAGLSASAYLGAPLSKAPVNSTWYGKFGVGEYKIDFALDITFAKTNGISGGTISAFVRESAGVYYLLEGDFTRAGVIRGTVNYGEFTNGVRNAPEAGRTPNGTLTGLIGQGGVLGVFISGTRAGFGSILTDGTGATGYSGGFYASASGANFGTVADYADWVRSFLFLADQPDTSTPQNQFLPTADLAVNAINTIGTTTTNGGSTPPTASTLNLNATNDDGGTLGGLNGNAVQWFSGYIGATQYHYAGVFEDANLGAPLTETPTGGEWRGIIGVGGAQTDFTLTVTYGGAGGTISAFVRDTTDVYYLLEGGFDANGLIDGTVKYGEFTNPSTAVGSTEDGVLTGIIGAEGALGVFYSEAVGATGYSGGFVARPNAPEYAVVVKYSDYQRSFLTLDTPDTTSPKNQFVTDATGVMTEQNGGTPASQNTLALDTTTFDNLALGGTADNSLFWFDGFADNTTRTYYAGLNGLANLGLPIVASGNWRGVFGLGNAKTDFTLNITYGTGGGLISAFIRELEDNYYLLAGDFDANGLITGTVKYGAFTNHDKNTPDGTTVDGVLTGLIGAEGAIGAFYSTATGPTGYSGGFSARDNVADFAPSTIGYVTWARGFLLADTPDVSKPRNQFLRAKSNGELDITGGTNAIIVDLNTAEFNGLSIGGLDTNRYQSFNRTLGNNQYNYAGILPNTDLGGRLVSVASTKAIWYGSFRAVNAGTAYTSDFVLHLTIDGTGGRLSARANQNNTDYYVLDGEFDASGLITGTVAHNSGSFDTTANGILTGLIGSGGAVGVFIGDTSSNYSGGFVAKAKADDFTDSVKYSDWVARENPILTPTVGNQFLQTTNKIISTMGATSTPPYILSLNSTNFDLAPILGDRDDGVAYFVGTIGGTAYAYAGIFNSTDLGAPLVQTDQSIIWNGVVGFNGYDKDASFTITFIDNNGGTIEAFIANIIATEQNTDEKDFLIAGTFDDLGLITGTVNYAEYTDDLVGGLIIGDEQAGVLSGLLGQEGAVAAFHSTALGADAYSGGFIASAEVKPQVIATIWQDSFTNVADERIHDDPIATDLAAYRNQFLSGKAANYDIIYARRTRNPVTPITFGLGSASGASEATYKGIPLGGDNVGGIGYVRGVQAADDENFLYYAFLNEDSKIGVQIGQTTGTAYYNGKFRALARSGTDTDFRLTVNFGEETIAAFIQEDGGTNNYFYLTGSYDSVGVMTGTVQYGKFTDNNPLLWEKNENEAEDYYRDRRIGLLSGIISKDNALGVFVSGTALEERGVATGGRGNIIGFAGGFVARRFDFFDKADTTVDYTGWARWFSPRAKADTADTSTQKNQFLTTLGGISTQGTTAPTAITTATLNDVYYKPVEIPGDAKDGFAYFVAGDYSYAGILDSTDLGAPLRGFNGTKATWHGQLNFRNAEHDFAININYGNSGGTINGFLANIVSPTDFALYGDFNEHGVITGLTKFAEYTNDTFDGMAINAPNGILTGIIGQEGAVGVFHSTALGADGYVGGFVVHPQGVDSADVNYSDWIRGKSYRTNPTGTRQFLRTTTNTDGVSVISTEMVAIVAGEEVRTPLANLSPVTYLTLNNATFGIKNTVGRMTNFISYDKSIGGELTPFSFTYESNTFEGLEIGGDERNGLAYFSGGSEPYVGILDTTNLGKPLVRGAKTVLNWGGHLGIIVAHNSDSILYNRDLTLKITLTDTGGNIDATVNNLPIFNGDSDDVAFVIDGEFNSQGVITGTVNYGTRDIHGVIAGDRFSVAPLTGIIGQEGAVGVFRGRSRGYAGGFVAHPDVVDRVVYADWVKANPVLGEKEDPVDEQPIRTTSGFNDFQSVTLFGAWDSPARGNHFLTTKNDVIGIGSASSDPNFNNLIRVDDRTQELVNNSYPQIAVTPRYLRFDDFTFGGEKINTDAKGGIAGFTGRFGTKATFYTYVGILDSTDLGPALAQSVDVAWQGRFFYNDFVSGFSDNFSVQRDFTLNITFKGTGGEVWGFLANIGDNADDVVEGEEINTAYFQTNDIYLQGKFGFDGVISGNTALKNYPKNEYSDNDFLKKDLEAIIANVIHPTREPKDDDPTTIYPDNSGQQERVNSQLGILTGLIGQHGAVGVWHAINWSASNGGGFIVAPPASSDVESAVEHYAAWQASFDDTPADTLTSAENRFLKVGQIEIPAQGSGSSTFVTGFKNLITQPDQSGRAANADTLNMRDALYLPKGSNQVGIALGGNANNVVYFDYGYYHAPSTEKDANTIISYHAAIGANANVGAALPVWESQQPASAVWKGSFRGQVFNDAPTTDRSFELEVDFQNRRVEAFVPVRPDLENNVVHYHLRGEFPEDLNGALIGTVDRGDFINNDRLQPDGDNTPGVFTGLIGQQGAIGAFVSGTRAGNGSALEGGTGETGYSGGFVACPYDEANNRCASQ